MAVDRGGRCYACAIDIIGQPQLSSSEDDGRPRKWASDAERMRAYRARRRAEHEDLERRADQGELFERVRAVTDQRDELQREVNELRAHLRELEHALALADALRRAAPPAASGSTPQGATALEPSRAERRRRERSERKRRPRG